MESKDDFSWPQVIIVTLFCVLSALGAAFSFKGMTEEHSGPSLVGGAVGVAVFITISTVFLAYILSLYRKQ